MYVRRVDANASKYSVPALPELILDGPSRTASSVYGLVFNPLSVCLSAPSIYRLNAALAPDCQAISIECAALPTVYQLVLAGPLLCCTRARTWYCPPLSRYCTRKIVVPPLFRP